MRFMQGAEYNPVMRNRFFLFLASAGKWGISLMTGGLFSWGFAAYEHFSGKSIPGFWWGALGLALFMVGAYLAWNDEHNKFAAEKDKNEKPNFVLRVESVITYYNAKLNGTTICFGADLTNYGSPSQASGWVLNYRSPTIEAAVKHLSLHEERVVFPVAGGHNLVLKRAEMLPARALNAIERGHTKHGRIIFELAGDRRNEIQSGAALMGIGCCDIYGKFYPALFKAGPETVCEQLNTYPDEEIEPYSNPPVLPSK